MEGGGCCGEGSGAGGGGGGGGGGGSWWGKWGGIGSKMCKNLVPPIFPRSIQKRLLFKLSCLNGDRHLSYY